MELEHILGIQVLFLGGITAGHHSLNMDIATIMKYVVLLARYTAYLLSSQFLELGIHTIYTAFQTRQFPELHWKDKYKNAVYAFGVSTAVLAVNSQLVLNMDLVLILIACSISRYIEAKRRSATISYGEGMACSFAEGYLYQVIPSDGARFYGLNEQIREAEADQRVIFPVRRLFIVITKSLFCPPNLEHFNKNDPMQPSMEACRSLSDVQKDVAGVRDRVYRNTTYKIRRHPDDHKPVYVVAECATPLHTLWKVLQRRTVYQRLADADGAEITEEFCATLPTIVANSPELRGRVEMIYFDDTNPDENLAEVLLAKIREIEPDFENITRNE
ncbi:stimulator of interferon genes protein-like isoform X2 [Leguminivora glycinivorella]|uniref:stimulator of interferon genes protein-like isoform X1 n=1 Tax=Leguminivora glycinivorella TaxID=1035111 RepID=UPI00200BFA64|nr:stimulator of interferon genes protein-like isoform X1 [Leguminivora glycinivorella]XP_047992277.1 stimulator of interferon genes protein-like isoform X2 [Leguminivora glycinivorella]